MMNEKFEYDTNDNSKNSFHSISKLMNDKQDDQNLDEENNLSKSMTDKEIDLNDSQNSEHTLESDLIDYLKVQINKNVNDLNSSKDDFDRIIKQIIEKSQFKFSIIPRNHVLKLTKKVLGTYDLDYNINESDSSISPPDVKPSRASSSSGYNSIPSPSSSSSSGSSQKHSMKTDQKNVQKKLKTSPEAQQNSFFDIKSFTKPTQSSMSQASNLPLNPFTTWNPNMFDPELLRLAAANSNPLLRFPDLNSFNPYVNNNLNNFSNLFRPNLTSTPSQPFTSPVNQVPTKKETEHKINSTSQNGVKPVSTQSMRLQTNKQESLAASLANSKFKLSNQLSKLSVSEIQTVKSLITSYRESAAFLSRSADELEQLIRDCHDK